MFLFCGFSMVAVWALVSMICLSWFLVVSISGFSMFAVWALVSMICLNGFCCFHWWLQYVCSLGFGFSDMPELGLVFFIFGFSICAVWALASMIYRSCVWVFLALVSVCLLFGLWLQ